MVEKRKTICLFCSLGCGVAFRTSDGQVTAIDYDKENPINLGSLCPRGYYNLELINHPQRLTQPQIGEKKVSWDEALSFARNELKKFDPSSIGISVSSIASNEDAYAAGLMAKALGIKNIMTSGDPAGLEAYRGNKWAVEGANQEKAERIGESEVLMIIGDILTRSPVLSKRINQVKYGKRGNQVIVIDPNVTRTSWFATTHLKNRPGTEAVLMAAILKVLAEENKRDNIEIDLQEASRTVGIPADAIINAAKVFDAAKAGTIIFAPGNDIQRNDLVQYFIRVASSFSTNKKHITFHGFGNTLGVNTVIDAMINDREVPAKDLKALISLGDDADTHGTEFTVKACCFAPDTAREGTVLLPLASQMEEKGSVILAGGRIESFEPLVRKVGGRSVLEITALLVDARTGAGEMLAKGPKEEKVDLKQKIAEAQDIKAREAVLSGNITHFGDNSLVKRFFWYRVNNKNG
ncbi:MAG: molybdopterin-dependent oxidoreductase [bacterium]